MQVHQPEDLFDVFLDGILASSDGKQQATDVSDGPSTPTAAVSDWTDVKIDTSTGEAESQEVLAERQLPGEVSAPASAFPRARVSFLPDAMTLPSPNELLLKPPYHLIVHVGQREVEIQGSHSPSLVLLSEYLKRWCRVNHHDTRTVSSRSVARSMFLRLALGSVR